MTAQDRYRRRQLRELARRLDVVAIAGRTAYSHDRSVLLYAARELRDIADRWWPVSDHGRRVR